MRPIWRIDAYRLTLLRETDTTEIAHYYQRNRHHLKRWDPLRPESFYTIKGWQRRIQTYLLLMAQQQLFCFVIHEGDQIIGIINYSHVKQFPLHSCAVGYSLDKNRSGLGLMTRSLIILNQWVFQQGIHRINASVMPENIRSRTLLSKLGFNQEGFAKQYLLIDGVWQDHYLMALINCTD